MKVFITALALLSSVTTILAQYPEEQLYQSAVSSPMSSDLPMPSVLPGQATGTGRGPTGKCIFGRNYCGWSIRTFIFTVHIFLHSY
jgi:hypothetical protein